MTEITVDGEKRILLKWNSDDSCPICDKCVKDMVFSWNIFHGEATSNCCGAIYQLKGWRTEKSSEEENKFQDLLGGFGEGYIWLKFKYEWIKPIHDALIKTGEKYINDLVLETAETIKNEETK